jgi:hopanoid biosynthesis associated RND transporter like protein HpnN
MDEAQVPNPQSGWVVRRLARFVDLVCLAPRLVLAGAALACVVSAYAAWNHLEYRTQRTDLVHPSKEYQARWRAYIEEFGEDDDLVVVVKGGAAERMKEALEAIAVEVGKRPTRFDRLFYKVDLRALRDRALLFLPSERIAEIQRNLASMSMLLEPPVVGVIDPYIGWRSLTMQRLLSEARQRAAAIVPSKPLTQTDEQFLTQLREIVRSASEAVEKDGAYRNPWRSLLDSPPEQEDLLAEPQYFFSGDGSLAFLLCRPVKDKSHFTDCAESVQAMREVLREVTARFPDLEMGLTGLPVLENDEMAASKSDTATASWLALVGVAVLYFLVFRSWRWPFLTVLTLLVGTTWALGWLTLTVGHLNILSVTFAVMLIGLGDYGILWVTRYDEERAACIVPREAMRRTTASVGPSIATASITTALAFFAAMFADFQAVAELGWIAGSGVLLCALACFTVLPSLLILFDRPRAASASVVSEAALGLSQEEGTKQRNILTMPARYREAAANESDNPCRRVGRAWLPGLASRPEWVLTTGFGLTAAMVLFAFQVEYDHNLLHLQARDLESVKWETTLIEHTAGASWHALSVVETPAEALQLKARYEQLPSVSRVVEVASLIPSGQEKKMEQLADIQRRLRCLPPRGEVLPRSTPSVRQVRVESDCLIGALQPLADASPQPLLGELRRSLVDFRSRLESVPVALCGERLRRFEERLARDLADDLHHLRDVSRPEAIRLSDLPVDLRCRYVGTNGKFLLRVFGKECLWDYRPLGQFCDAIQKVDPEATGKPFLTFEGLEAMQNGFLWAGVYALAAIVIVLFLDFRKPGRVVLALLPLGLGVVLALGVMGLCDMALNPANMIALPLILGVGVDNGVHVLHDFLSRRRQGRYALDHATGLGIFVAALTTVLGFGTLMIARHRGLFGLGFILALGVTCCMFASLVVLPAVLRLLGRTTPPEAEDLESTDSTALLPTPLRRAA